MLMQRVSLLFNIIGYRTDVSQHWYIYYIHPFIPRTISIV